MIAWAEPTYESLAAPALSLLERALAGAPDNPVALAKLGNVHIDRYDFAKAAEAFRKVLDIEPRNLAARGRLARCYNELGRQAECLALLEPDAMDDAAQADANLCHQRAIALAALGRPETAEANLRQALARQPGHVHALVMLARLLRKSGRGRELAALCGDIASRGVRHAQLLLESGRAAALTGDMAGARRLLLDHGRVARGAAPVPAPFADHAAFNAAFAEELLSNPVILDRFGTDDANRGSRRIHHLTGGRRPELVRALTTAIQAAIDRFVAALPAHGFDPWLEAVPRLARLNSWGLIQRSGEYEAWHLHRGGWLSGVYYVQLPAAFSVAGEGAGCIEFGAPPSLATAGLAPSPPLRIAPQAGMLLLAPSHYHHRTIPFAAPGYRLSFAFDVVPLDNL